MHGETGQCDALERSGGGQTAGGGGAELRTIICGATYSLKTDEECDVSCSVWQLLPSR